MELDALLAALRYVRDNPSHLGVQRIQIVTDSMYVYENFSERLHGDAMGGRISLDVQLKTGICERTF